VVSRLPTGTITFLFTDIEGSTRLWEQQTASMQKSLARHDALLRSVIEARSGHVFKTVGDAFCAAFDTALECLKVAVDAQLALAAEPWDVEGGIRVRMALHTGSAEERDGDYFGPTLNRVARLLGIGHGGQILVSLVTEELIRDALPEAVSLRAVGEHRLKDLMRPESVYQVYYPGLRADFPALKSLDTHPNNLPLQPTPLIGREKELATLKGMLRGDTARVLTLVGPGGMGKTRLALQTAADAIDGFEDGVFFVDLSAIESATLVIPAVARTLGVKEIGGKPVIENLRDFMSHKRMLLILDNCEQIPGMDPYVVSLLAACPSLKLIVTSREALHLRGEQVFPVPALSIPTIRLARALDMDQLHQFEAVTLFIQRACAVVPDFTVTNENAPYIAEICSRLDGLPLAIELAAARIVLLTPQAILDRLGQRLKLLSSGLSDLPHRQRTLRATIDWSYRLLSPEEQTLFRELSVFEGGASLEAIETVCTRAEETSELILETLAGLVGKSLIMREDRLGAPHFVMLESIRDFAREQLERAEGTQSAFDAHAGYFLSYAEHLKPLLRGATRKQTLDQFEACHENFQAAINRFNEKGKTEEEVRLCVALGAYWRVRGYLSIGLQCVTRAHANAVEAPLALRADALAELGALEGDQGDYQSAVEHLESALDLNVKAQNTEGFLFCKTYLGELARLMGKLDVARSHFSGICELSEAAASRHAANARMGLGLLDWQEGNTRNARFAFEEALTLARSLGEVSLQAQAAGNLGVLFMMEESLDAACAGFEEARLIHEELGDIENTIVAYNNLGNLNLRKGDFHQATVSYERVARLARGLGNDRWLVLGLCGLSDSWRQRGDSGRSLDYARQARAAGENFEPAFETGVTERVLGDAFLACGLPREARECFTRAITLLENMRDAEDLALARKGHEQAVRSLGSEAVD